MLIYPLVLSVLFHDHQANDGLKNKDIASPLRPLLAPVQLDSA